MKLITYNLKCKSFNLKWIFRFLFKLNFKLNFKLIHQAKKKKKITLIRSPFIFSKSKEQFEKKETTLLIQIKAYTKYINVVLFEKNIMQFNVNKNIFIEVNKQVLI